MVFTVIRCGKMWEVIFLNGDTCLRPCPFLLCALPGAHSSMFDSPVSTPSSIATARLGDRRLQVRSSLHPLGCPPPRLPSPVAGLLPRQRHHLRIPSLLGAKCMRTGSFFMGCNGDSSRVLRLMRENVEKLEHFMHMSIHGDSKNESWDFEVIFPTVGR